MVKVELVDLANVEFKQVDEGTQPMVCQINACVISWKKLHDLYMKNKQRNKQTNKQTNYGCKWCNYCHLILTYE